MGVMLGWSPIKPENRLRAAEEVKINNRVVALAEQLFSELLWYTSARLQGRRCTFYRECWSEMHNNLLSSTRNVR